MKLAEIMKSAGIIGAGGAGFPSYAKLAEGADTLLVNGSECEPLLYTDYYILKTELSRVISGARAVISQMNIPRALLCVKQHTADMLSLNDGERLDDKIFVKCLPNVYPIGDEISLIYQSLGRVVKPGNLPISAGVIVYNVETLYNLAGALEGKPVYEKWLTVGGDVKAPVVVRVPVGYSVAKLLAELGIEVGSDHAVLDGGPSMGRIINPDAAVITKTTKSLLVIPDSARCIQNKKVAMDDMMRRATSACCACTRCTEMCPRHALGYPLEPHKMIRAALNSAVVDYPELIKTASLCCSCGVCAEVCCQEISPKDVILNLKGILAKNKMRFVAGEESYQVNPDRPYRMIQSVRWEEILGIHKYDIVPKFIQKKIPATRVEILMSQHIGAPSTPAVSVGDEVSEGQLIANAGAGLSLPQYASIAGRVVSVDPTKIVIEA